MLEVEVFVEGRHYDVFGEGFIDQNLECILCGNKEFGPRMRKIAEVVDLENGDGNSLDAEALERILAEVNLKLAVLDGKVRCGGCFEREFHEVYGVTCAEYILRKLRFFN